MTIETNTEELREILQTVYDLPSAGGGGSNEPDLVIGMNVANTKLRDNDDGGRSIVDMSIDDFSVEQGSAALVAEKLAGQIPVKVLLREIHFYNDSIWYEGLAEATHVSLVHAGGDFPSGDVIRLAMNFYVVDMPYFAPGYPVRIKVLIDMKTGVVCEIDIAEMQTT